jgi:hypothetical protein
MTWGIIIFQGQDIYYADLDFILRNEKEKEGYESGVESDSVLSDGTFFSFTTKLVSSFNSSSIS